MSLFFLRSCNHCRGDLIITEEEIKCMQCGRYTRYRESIPIQPVKRVEVRTRLGKYAT